MITEGVRQRNEKSRFSTSIFKKFLKNDVICEQLEIFLTTIQWSSNPLTVFTNNFPRGPFTRTTSNAIERDFRTRFKTVIRVT